VFQGGKVERIHSRADAGRLDVHELARGYLADHINNTIAFHAGVWWEYQGRHYRQVSPDYLDGKVRLWLTAQGYNPKPQVISNLLGQLRAVVYVDPEATMPCWLNPCSADPAPNQIISFRNGLLDIGRHLATGDTRLLAHTPRWFSAVSLPYDFDPQAECPRWRASLREWLVDDDQIELLQTWMGYCMTTDNSLQKFLFLLGPTRSGKSSTLTVLTQVLGRQNVAAASFQSLSGEFGLAELVGRQAVTISEIHADRSARNVVQVIKNITGNDPVPVNRKGLPIVSLVLPVRLTIAANQMPRLPDDSGALKARMLLLHYPNSFLGKENLQLANELEAEVAGIATWALQGLSLLRQRGYFLRSVRGEQFLDDMGHLSAPVEQFLSDNCDEAPDQWEATEELYGVWRLWCREEGHEPGSKNVFGSKLKAARPTIRNGQRRVAGGRKVRYYAGVQLNSDGLALLERFGGKPAINDRRRARASHPDSDSLSLSGVRLAELALVVSGGPPDTQAGSATAGRAWDREAR